jgi:hypothetical protein
MVRYFDAATLPYGIMVEVNIGAFVEAVVRGFVSRWGEIIVDICKAVCFSTSLPL